jgi:hypothetical protein
LQEQSGVIKGEKMAKENKENVCDQCAQKDQQIRALTKLANGYKNKSDALEKKLFLKAEDAQTNNQ